MGRRTKIDKRTLWDVVELAYAEGIGCRRLGAMIGYSPMWLREIARDLGMPRLSPHSGGKPSEELQRRVAKVKALVDATTWR